MSGNIALTSTQTAIWLDQAQQPKKPIYNTGEQIRLTERLDSACFSAAVDHVVSETEALRLVFRSTGGPISAAIVPPERACLAPRPSDGFTRHRRHASPADRRPFHLDAPHHTGKDGGPARLEHSGRSSRDDAVQGRGELA